MEKSYQLKSSKILKEIQRVTDLLDYNPMMEVSKLGLLCTTKGS
jgi:hypothetical protein